MKALGPIPAGYHAIDGVLAVGGSPVTHWVEEAGGTPLFLYSADLIRERVKSGLAAARARGKRLGRQPGQRPSDKKAKRVLGLHKDGLSYRLIARNVGLSKNTVMDIVRRALA